MIKVKSIGYQTDEVVAEIAYDLDGVEYSFTVHAKVLSIAKMTVDDIKNYIIGRVVTERNSKVKSLVDDKLNPLIDVDIEET